MESGQDYLELVEEKDWGLPWPNFEGQEDRDVECNLRIYEVKHLTMPVSTKYREELDRLVLLEESRRKVKRLLAERVRYIRKMTRLLFKRNTEKMSKSGYFYYTRILAMFIANFGFSVAYPIEIRISILSIAFTFAFVLQ